MSNPYFDAAARFAPDPYVQVLPDSLRGLMFSYGEKALARRATQAVQRTADVALRSAQQSLAELAASGATAVQQLRTELESSTVQCGPGRAPCREVPGAPPTIQATLGALGAAASALAGDANAAAARRGTNPAAPFLADSEYRDAAASQNSSVQRARDALVRIAQGEVLR